MPRRAISLGALALALAATEARAQSKTTVLQAWRTRTGRIDSAALRWVEVQSHRRDWLPNPLHAEPDHEKDRDAGDRVDSVIRQLQVAGSRMQVSATLRSGRGARVPVRTPWSEQHPAAQQLPLRPALLALRPFDRHHGLRGLPHAVVRGIKDSLYRGQALLIVTEPPDSAGWRFALWLDPTREFVVRRYVLLKNDVEMLFQDVDYYADPVYSWLPCRWTTTRRKPAGQLWRSDTAVLTGITINGGARPMPELPGSARRERTCR